MGPKQRPAVLRFWFSHPTSQPEAHLLALLLGRLAEDLLDRRPHRLGRLGRVEAGPDLGTSKTDTLARRRVVSSCTRCTYALLLVVVGDGVGLGVVGGEALAESVGVVVRALDQRLASDVVGHRLLRGTA